MLLSAKNIYLALVLSALSLLVFTGQASAQAPPAAPPAGSTLEQRVAQRKQERQTNLDEKTAKRVQDKCTVTQNKIRTLKDGYTVSADNRNNTYRKIDAKIWVVIGSLKLIDKDTFKLEQQRQELAKQAAEFDTASAQFKQTLDDVAAINCKADPNGFMALVETSRLYNAQIRTSFKNIRAYVTDQVKPTITQHSDDLKIKASTE